MKVCNKCYKEKELEEFYKTTRNKTGYENVCKLCKNKYNKSNSIKLGKEYFRKISKKWTDNNKDKKSEYNKQNYNKNKNYWKDNRKYYNIEWRKQNKSKLKEYTNKKYKDDINYRLSSLFRHRLYFALNRNTKIKSALKLLGCSIEECKLYLESKFKPEMNWDNHGIVWEIDHIIPCSSFDLTKEEEQQKCFHYTNLQPLFKTTEIAELFGYKNEIGNRNKTNNIY